MSRGLRKTGGGLVQLETQGKGIDGNIDPAISALATVGAGTLTAQLMDSGFIYRTGPTAAFAETFDTGANIELGFGADMDIGDTKFIVYSNQVAFIPTFTASTGVTIGSTKAIGVASTLALLLLKKTAVATYVAYVL